MNRSEIKAKKIVDKEMESFETYSGNIRLDLKRLWNKFLSPHRAKIIVALFLTVIISMQVPAFALTWRFLVDKALCIKSEVNQGSKSMLLIWFAMNMGIWTVHLFSTWIRTYLIQTTGQRLTYSLRRTIHEKLQVLHIGFYESTSTGRLMSRILGDVNVLHQWTTNQTINLITQIFTLLLGLGTMFYIHPGMASLMLITMPVYAYAFVSVRPHIRRFNIALRRMNSSLYGHTAERISGIEVVQAFGREKSETRNFAKRVNNMIRTHMSLVNKEQILALSSVTLSSVTTAVVLYRAFSMVHHNQISLGSAMAFIHAMPAVFMAINQITDMVAALQGPMVCMQRIFRLLDTEEEVVPGRLLLDGMVGRISLNNVTFHYPGQDKPALNDVSFKINPGEHIAIMGPSGAGKSTLFTLLLRFYDPDEGAVRVGGVNLSDASPNSIRKHVCMVQQEPHVFSGTLAQNIMYGMLNATPSDVIRAAKNAEIHDFIMSLPLKYETEVGEQGVTLSGGQRQRLALATALLSDPEILLLDDTTSALDSVTEARIRETLNKVLQNRTSLIITQRVATARDTDRIIVLENGSVSQIGTHEELSHIPGFYQTILRQQNI